VLILVRDILSLVLCKVRSSLLKRNYTLLSLLILYYCVDTSMFKVTRIHILTQNKDMALNFGAMYVKGKQLYIYFTNHFAELCSVHARSDGTDGLHNWR
jgi:hypothetical protein